MSVLGARYTGIGPAGQFQMPFLKLPENPEDFGQSGVLHHPDLFLRDTPEQIPLITQSTTC
jgi:hypothetical protein